MLEVTPAAGDALDGFRSRQIPLDNIVEDWQYWPRDAWGSHQFDPQRFPDPEGWIKSIHDKHAHLVAVDLGVVVCSRGTRLAIELAAHDRGKP